MGNTPSCLKLKKFKKQKREKKCFYMIKTMDMELKEAARLNSGNPHHAEVAERLVRLGNQHNMFHAQLEDLDKASDALVITVRRDVDRSYYAARTIYETVLENSCNGQTNGRIAQEIDQMSKITNLYLTVPDGKTESQVYGIAGKVVPPGLDFKYERSVKS